LFDPFAVAHHSNLFLVCCYGILFRVAAWQQDLHGHHESVLGIMENQNSLPGQLKHQDSMPVKNEFHLDSFSCQAECQNFLCVPLDLQDSWSALLKSQNFLSWLLEFLEFFSDLLEHQKIDECQKLVYWPKGNQDAVCVLHLSK
jgi:hypothetical protein